MGNVGTVALQGKSLARTVPPLLALVKESVPSLSDAAAKGRLAEGTCPSAPLPLCPSASLSPLSHCASPQRPRSSSTAWPT